MASRSGLPVVTSHQEMSSFYIYIYMSLKRSLCIVHWRRLGGCGQHCYCQLCSNWSVSECQCCQLFRNDLSQIKHASNGNGCHRLKMLCNTRKRCLLVLYHVTKSYTIIYSIINMCFIKLLRSLKLHNRENLVCNCQTLSNNTCMSESKNGALTIAIMLMVPLSQEPAGVCVDKE